MRIRTKESNPIDLESDLRRHGEDDNSWDAVSAKGYTVREYRLFPVEENSNAG